jgi:hypothetical protein
MGWADWMVIDMSLEDELQLERQARTILHHDDHDEIAKLCFSLIKQTHYQQILLNQAVGRITELETQSFIDELDEESLKAPTVNDIDGGIDRRMSWWRRILSSD